MGQEQICAAMVQKLGVECELDHIQADQSRLTFKTGELGLSLQR